MKQATYKYGIEVLTSVEHTQRIDLSNGNRHWTDTIDKEMKQVIVAFEILEEGVKAPVGWSASNGHLVFDVKMDFSMKA